MLYSGECQTDESVFEIIYGDNLVSSKELGIFEKTTKTQSSDRIIYISDKTINILKAYKKEQLENKHESEIIKTKVIHKIKENPVEM